MLQEAKEAKEISKFQSDLRSFGGRAIDLLTQLGSRVESFFGLPEKRKAAIERAAEEKGV